MRLRLAVVSLMAALVFEAANFGMITSTAGARVIQLNARFSF